MSRFDFILDWPFDRSIQSSARFGPMLAAFKTAILLYLRVVSTKLFVAETGYPGAPPQSSLKDIETMILNSIVRANRLLLLKDDEMADVDEMMRTVTVRLHAAIDNVERKLEQYPRVERASMVSYFNSLSDRAEGADPENGRD